MKDANSIFFFETHRNIGHIALGRRRAHSFSLYRIYPHRRLLKQSHIEHIVLNMRQKLLTTFEKKRKT